VALSARQRAYFAGAAPSSPSYRWQLIQPLLPTQSRRCRYPGRKRLDDRKVLAGILYVPATGIAWEDLPNSWATAPA